MPFFPTPGPRQQNLLPRSRKQATGLMRVGDRIEWKGWLDILDYI